MARKRNFADLLHKEMNEPITDLQTSNDTDSESLVATGLGSPKLSDRIEAKVSSASRTIPSVVEIQTPEVTESGSFVVPKYQTLDRKETRLRADQLEALNTITKGLNRKRRGKGERLTDNTLIRVAVDLLLSRVDSLQGVTEEELRQSLGLTDSRTL